MVHKVMGFFFGPFRKSTTETRGPKVSKECFLFLYVDCFISHLILINHFFFTFLIKFTLSKMSTDCVECSYRPPCEYEYKIDMSLHQWILLLIQHTSLVFSKSRLDRTQTCVWINQVSDSGSGEPLVLNTWNN